MAYRAVQYVVTTSAVSLTSALGLTGLTNIQKKALNIDVTAKSTNVGKVYLGGSGVTNVPANAGVEITAGGSWNSGPSSISFPVSLDEIFIVGTAADIVFVTIIN